MPGAEHKTVLEFTKEFLQITGLPLSVDAIFALTIDKALEIIDTNDDPLDDKYADALRIAGSDVSSLQELFATSPEYYVIFFSSLMVVLDEQTLHIEFTPDQKNLLGKLLDSVNVFD